jgi:hypothetical protein
MFSLQEVGLETYEALRNSGNTQILSVRKGMLDKATEYLRLEGFIPYYASDSERRFYNTRSRRRPLEFAVAKIF